jgi:hypothetical protein
MPRYGHAAATGRVPWQRSFLRAHSIARSVRTTPAIAARARHCTRSYALFLFVLLVLEYSPAEDVIVDVALAHGQVYTRKNRR